MPPFETTRRRFLQTAAVVGAGATTWLRSGDARAALDAAHEQAASDLEWPVMPRRKLGRTEHDASRLIFGCGAALARQPREALLETALEAGINVFDVGYRGYYADAEKNLAPFLKRHRDEVFLISKAIPSREIEPDQPLSASQRRAAARHWTDQMEGSLRELAVDRVDAYYLMASNNVELIGSDEIREAFERARDAGKVRHLGLSTHQNAEQMLSTAIDTGLFDLAMIAITPAGWYDWADKGILKDSKPMKALAPLLARARASGMGLIGMKAGRYLAGRKFLGWGNPRAFDEHYDEAFLAASLSPYQRSYAYVLAHGLDCVNADMHSLAHLHENAVAAALSARQFAGLSTAA